MIKIHEMDGNTFAKRYFVKDYHIDIYWCQICGYRSSRNREQGNCWNGAFQKSFPKCPDCGKENWKVAEGQ